MTEDGIRFTVACKLAESRSDDDCNRQRAQSSDRMDNPGTCEINVAFTKPEIGAKVRQPAASPGPIGEQRISKSCEQKGCYREGGKFPAFRGRARRNRRGGDH